MKKIFIVLMCLFSVSSFAEPLKGNLPQDDCTPVPVTTWPVTKDSSNADKVAFCQQFAKQAYCGCTHREGRTDICQNMKVAGIYKAMIAFYGTETRACDNPHVQTQVPTQTCVDQWDAYNNADVIGSAFAAANGCN